jgi:hypothetical protein
VKNTFFLAGMFGILLAFGFTLGGCTTTEPFDLTNNPVGSKVGEATGTINFNGAFGATADYSLQTAAKNGGITRIATVDLRVYNVLGLIKTYTTIVTGE